MKTIELVDVSTQYRRGCGLRGLTLAAGEGESVALFGPSGAGKTTVLKVLAGLLQPSSGSARILQQPPKQARDKVGFASGSPGAPPSSTAAQIVAKSLAARDVPGYQRAARAAEALDVMGLFDDRDRQLNEMGGAALASARLAAEIAHCPAVLLLDNATAALPEPVAARFWRHVNDRRAVDGLTVLHTTARSADAEAADRVVLLDRGVLIADDSPAALQEQFGETLVIEAADTEAIRRTLRGLYEVVLEETPDGLRISTPAAVPAAAHLFRHPVRGFRSVLLRRQDLWEVHRALAEQAQRQRT